LARGGDSRRKATVLLRLVKTLPLVEGSHVVLCPITGIIIVILDGRRCRLEGAKQITAATGTSGRSHWHRSI
jgi:hypothetical protein